MSFIATGLIATAGVCAYVAIYYGALYVLRRQREHFAFTGLAGSLAVALVGGAWTHTAASVAEAVPAQELELIGMFASGGFFVEFLLRIAEAPRRRVIQSAHAVASIGIAATLAGLNFDPAYAVGSYDFGPPSGTSVPIASLSPLGLVCTVALIGLGAYGIVTLIRNARGQRELRAAALLAGISLLVGAYDLSEPLFQWDFFQFTLAVAIVPVLSFSYVLIGRFTRVDAQLADRTEELVRSYDHLRLAQEELVKKEQLAAIGELSAVIAHEVRNPLAIIKNAASGLRRRELAPDDADTLLRILDDETDRLNRLINDLLAYARPVAPEPGEVDLRHLVMQAVELAAGGHRDSSRVEIELELERAVDRVAADEALLRHALINIVDNALQAMPDGGRLTITCRNLDERRPAVAVEFRDTGEGMDTLVRSKARDPFFTTRTSGTGLGLAIVDRVARAHGGRVELDSRHGDGTTVRLVVPRERPLPLERA